MGLRALGRIILKKFGIGGVMLLFGILGAFFLVRHVSTGKDDFTIKIDIIFTAAAFVIGGVILLVKFILNRKNTPVADNSDASSTPQKNTPVQKTTSNVCQTEAPASKVRFIDLKKEIVDPINAKYKSVPMLRFETIPQKTNIFDSKLGGIPYMPKNHPYPTGSGKFSGKPLKLLAQLNLDELIHIRDFPHGGMLQFFITCDSDLYGADTSDPNNRDGFKVVYHKEIIKDISQLMSEKDIPSFSVDPDHFPLSGEYLLKPRKAGMCKITAQDYRFEAEFIRLYNNITGENVSQIYEMNESLFGTEHTLEDMYDVLVNQSTCMGGYPYFTQNDPRSLHKDRQDKTVMLLQIDSEEDKGIMWGDNGVGSFFIRPEDLAAENFDNVLYTWDCY